MGGGWPYIYIYIYTSIYFNPWNSCELDDLNPLQFVIWIPLYCPNAKTKKEVLEKPSKTWQGRFLLDMSQIFGSNLWMNWSNGISLLCYGCWYLKVWSWKLMMCFGSDGIVPVWRFMYCFAVMVEFKNGLNQQQCMHCPNPEKDDKEQAATTTFQTMGLWLWPTLTCSSKYYFSFLCHYDADPDSRWPIGCCTQRKASKKHGNPKTQYLHICVS